MERQRLIVSIIIKLSRVAIMSRPWRRFQLYKLGISTLHKKRTTNRCDSKNVLYWILHQKSTKIISNYSTAWMLIFFSMKLYAAFKWPSLTMEKFTNRCLSTPRSIYMTVMHVHVNSLPISCPFMLNNLDDPAFFHLRFENKQLFLYHGTIKLWNLSRLLINTTPFNRWQPVPLFQYSAI